MHWLDDEKHRKHWELAVRGLSDGLWCLDLDNGEMWRSPEFWRLLGFDDAEIDSDEPIAFAEFLHTDDRLHVEHCLQQHLDSGTPFDVESRLRLKDGGYRWFRIRGTAEWEVGDSNSRRPVRVGGAIQDVHDLFEAARSREESERRAREQYHHTPVMMHSIDPNGVLIDVSDFWCQHLGYQRSEVIGTASSSILTDESRQRAVEEILPEFHREGRIIDVPYQVRRKSGEIRDVLLTAESIRGATGNTERSLVVMVDVTDRVQSEQALLLARSRLALTLSATKIGLWDWHTLTDEVFFSAQCKQLLGYDADENWNSFDHWERLVHPDDQADVFGQLAAYIDGRKSEYSTTYRLRAHDGSYRWVLARGRYLETPDGRRNRIAGILVDITEQKEVEKQLQLLTDELTRSNRELQQFAYVASHDLQEPLRAVESFCTLLKQRYADELDETGNEFIDFAVSGAQRMKSMIQSLLEYSRIGSMTPEHVACDMNAVVQTAIANLRMQIEESGTRIEVFEGLPMVSGDVLQLARVFQNLISNAIKFRKAETQPTIKVAFHEQDDHWIFEVVDDGIGFRTEFASEVFQIFRRLESRRDFAGNGIGLSICKRIVESHGGTITAESIPGVGSCFRFTIPKRAVDVAQA